MKRYVFVVNTTPSYCILEERLPTKARVTIIAESYNSIRFSFEKQKRPDKLAPRDNATFERRNGFNNSIKLKKRILLFCSRNAAFELRL